MRPSSRASRSSLRSSSLALLVSVAAFASAVAQGTSTALDGVYTTEQAARGEAVYTRSCAGCHEGQDADGPLLAGKVFLDRWREDTLEPLYGFIKTSMPGNNPGGLNDAAYVDVVAYVLEANGLPAGTRELSADMMGRVQLVGPDGPRPLSNLTIVRAVGCLTPAANDTWVLAKASRARPVRARVVGAATSEELQASAAQALGTQTYPLTSVPQRAASLSGHKVQVKGVLTRQNTQERINVMSLDSVAPACGG